MLKHLSRIRIIALVVAWGFDFLFWGKSPGISLAIYLAVLLLVGLVLAMAEKTHPAKSSLILLLPIGFFAVMTSLRMEPFTLLLNLMLALTLMAVLAHTFLGGRWYMYGLADYIAGFFMLVFHMINPPIQPRSGQPEEQAPADLPEMKPAQRAWKAGLPILRGVLLAVPVLAVFGGLLASADPVFSDSLSDLFSIFDVDKLPEYTMRLILILAWGYCLFGIYIHALVSSRDQRLIGLEKPLLPPFLGFTESVIVAGSVNLLFAFFVSIQFRYFFGGQANIHIDGYTYAEYARRGFGELVVVAFFSLLLFLGLSAIGRRQPGIQRRVFSGLGILLVLLVSVIQASAFQRLLLYEQAYGFSRLRAYTHVFMVWVGILLLAVVVLELTGRMRAFVLAALLALLGFGVTLNILNVDGFIARENISRAVAGASLDSAYLNTLSPDAIPAIAGLYTSGSLPNQVEAQVGGVLACQAMFIGEVAESLPWQGFHLARWRASRILAGLQESLSQYPLSRDERGSWIVSVDGLEQACLVDYWD